MRHEDTSPGRTPSTRDRRSNNAASGALIDKRKLETRRDMVALEMPRRKQLRLLTDDIRCVEFHADDGTYRKIFALVIDQPPAEQHAPGHGALVIRGLAGHPILRIGS